MKKYLFFMLAFALTCNVSVFPQNQHKDKSRESNNTEVKHEKVTADKRAEHMASKLDLTVDQKEKLKALFESQDVKRENRMADARKLSEEKKEIMKADRELHDAQLVEIIGKEKFDQLQLAHKGRKNPVKHKEIDKRGHNNKHKKDCCCK